MQSQDDFSYGQLDPASERPPQFELPPPNGDTSHDVLVEALLEESSVHQRRSPLDWVVSLALHIAILAVLMIIPLFFSAGLDFQKLNLTFLAAPVMPTAAPPPPPALSASRALQPAHTMPVRTFTPDALTAPSFIPRAIAASAEMATPDVSGMGGVPGGVSGGIPGGQVGGAVGGVLGGLPKGAPPPPALEGPRTPVQVGGAVKPPRLLFGPPPVYPPLAKQSRLTGVVVIEAIIDERGNVAGMRVISGQSLLIPAALSAVSKRKYEPTILDGEPTPVDMKVEVSFSFASSSRETDTKLEAATRAISPENIL